MPGVDRQTLRKERTHQENSQERKTFWGGGGGALTGVEKIMLLDGGCHGTEMSQQSANR